MISLLLSVALADECAAPNPVSGGLQVAWISPVRKRARSKKPLQVVRVGDLRAWVEDEGADQTRVLQGLGQVKKKPGWRAKRRYKVTLFDVNPGDLCRAIEDVPVGTDVAGVAACDELKTVRGESSCGWTVDTVTEARGLDTYRISWAEASVRGFCVFPLERFLVESAGR